MAPGHTFSRQGDIMRMPLRIAPGERLTTLSASHYSPESSSPTALQDRRSCDQKTIQLLARLKLYLYP